MGNICCCISHKKDQLNMNVRKARNSASASIKKSKISDEHNLRTDVDTISSLSDDLLLLILSFLDIKFAVKTSILSKRWRYLWLSLRVLNVDQRFYPWFKKYPFRNSLDKVITVLPDVQEMHLKLSSELPQCLFTWKSIRVLKLKGVDGFLWLRNPYTVDIPSLKALHLTRVVLDMKLVNDFISKCPLLEVLSLKCCEFIHIEGLNICSPQLKKLVILCDHKHYGCFKQYEIKIYAPNLTFFKCRDNIARKFSLENLSALVSADFDLKINEHAVPLCTKEENTKQVTNFLEGLCRAESLTLSASSLEIFSSVLEGLISLPSQFSNLRHLKLTARPDDAYTQVLQLLKNTPSVKSLLLETTWTNLKSYQGRVYWDEPSFYSTIMEVNWDEGLQFQFMLNQLKSVEFRNFLGCDNEIKILEALLKKATLLEKIKIILAQVWPHSREKMMWVVWKMLQRVPRASSDVMIEFANFYVLKL